MLKIVGEVLSSKNGSIVVRTTPPESKEIRVSCGFFCPVHELDTIVCYSMEGKLQEVPPYLAIIPKTREVMISNFRKANKYRMSKESMAFLQILKNVYGTFAQAFDYLVIISDAFSRGIIPNENYEDVIPFESLSIILRSWYKNVNMRRLYLLGLTNRIIESIEIPSGKLYDSIIKHGALQYPQIDDNLAKEIDMRIGRKETEDSYACSLVSREVRTSSLRSRGIYLETEKVSVGKMLNPKRYELLPSFGIIHQESRFVIDEYNKANMNVSKFLIALAKEKRVEMPVLWDEASHLDENQRKAIYSAMENLLTIVTGFAGTGKTTIIKEVSRLLKKRHVPFTILSFTGKAVARVKEVLDDEDISCMTMHLFLKKGSREVRYVIIDEMSTVCTSLFDDLLKVLLSGGRFLLLGDCNQLPPIEPGSLFLEMLRSKIFQPCKIELTNVYRTKVVTDGAGTRVDGILQNAMSMAIGNSRISPCANFQVVQGGKDTVLAIVSSLKEADILVNDFVVIYPYNRDISDINSKCQELFQKGTYTTDTLKRKWYVGDKAMLVENNYYIGVMNGEEGVVTNVEQGYFEVQFKRRKDTVKFLVTAKKIDEWNEPPNAGYLNHSYCITVHKSQGSEWNYVVLLVDRKEAGAFLNRNLLYTAITRAKVALYIVGDINVVQRIALMPSPVPNDTIRDMFGEMSCVTGRKNFLEEQEEMEAKMLEMSIQ